MQDPQMPVCTSQGQRFDSDQSVNAPSHSHPGKAVSAVRDQNAVTLILFLYFTFFFVNSLQRKRTANAIFALRVFILNDQCLCI